MSSFGDLVEKATGFRPYPWQESIAEASSLPDLIAVETGAGKTAGIVLGWLWHRRFHLDPAVRASTPHWLVLCLPLRVLTEQTERVVSEWLAALGLDGPDGVEVHVAMGGREDGRGDGWRERLERDAIIIGTVDMLVSRALNRGYGASRFAWPIDFGLLHSGVHWVFDEIQLLGPALATSRQLETFRRRYGTALPSSTTWMSATVDRVAMATVDNPDIGHVVELGRPDLEGGLARRLGATRRVEEVAVDGVNRARDLAAVLVERHRAGTLTIAVMNTVRAARELHDQVTRLAPNGSVHLLHSRFRPPERARIVEEVLAPVGPGRIVISTQVLEAGVDVSAATLLTEVAPWPSIVQRAGRCNRDGESEDAALLWVRPAQPAPYAGEDIDATTAALVELEGRAVTATELRQRDVPVLRPVLPVLRARDILGLFDTAPDLSGNDIDVAPYIRVGEELDAHIAWRDLGIDPPPPDMSRPQSNELCPVPAGSELRDLAKVVALWRFDHLDNGWSRVRATDVRPGLVAVADCGIGRYKSSTGWESASRLAVASLAATAPPALVDVEEGVGDDPVTFAGGQWVALLDHLDAVGREAARLLEVLDPAGLDPATRDAAVVAARLHDIGKAHDVFQDTMLRCALDDERATIIEGAPWAKSAGGIRARHARPNFRHELASALALLGEGRSLLDQVEERDLVLYLIASHHGRVRLGIRSAPGETDKVLGIADGDTLPETAVPGGVLPGSTLHLAPMLLGRDTPGERSWAERAIGLRDRSDLGIFRLAFLEAIVRLADWRASAESERSLVGASGLEDAGFPQ